MIGHYLLTLTPEQEDRALTGKMRPGCYDEVQDIGPCLVGTAQCIRRHTEHVHVHNWPPFSIVVSTSVEGHYDSLCHRFGPARVNAAIRTRILANQARRALQREAAHVGA